MLRSHREGERVTVQLTGELDHCSAAWIRRELDGLIADPGVRWLILDFGHVQMMDSSGIGVVLGRYRRLRERGGAVGVTGMTPQIARIFRISGMDRVIHHVQEVAK